MQHCCNIKVCYFRVTKYVVILYGSILKIKDMRWRSYLLLFFAACWIQGCSSDDNGNNELTGRALVYPLASGSDYNTSGTVTFQEKKDGNLRVVVEIGPTGLEVHHPVHLHYGAYEKDAPMAALLQPAYGMTGKSTTDNIVLADYTLLTYDDLKNFDGHVKVHGDDDANKDLILACGNIGTNKDLPLEFASNISQCK